MQAGRKRYTVALGGPIVAPSEVELDYESERSVGMASFSSTAESSEDDDDYQNAPDETLGKKSAFRVMTTAKFGNGDLASAAPANNSPGNHVRAQSTYNGFPNALQSNQAVSAQSTQSTHRFRSQSIDFRSDSTFGGDQANKFVDPLVLRRQEKTEKGRGKPLVGPGKKVPVGQLVAFFDSERR
jgi:hypothetical protein